MTPTELRGGGCLRLTSVSGVAHEADYPQRDPQEGTATPSSRLSAHLPELLLRLERFGRVPRDLVPDLIAHLCASVPLPAQAEDELMTRFTNLRTMETDMSAPRDDDAPVGNGDSADTQASAAAASDSAGARVPAVVSSTPGTPMFGFDMQDERIAGFDAGAWSTKTK